MSLSSTIKSIQKIMRQDSGIDGDAQRISQLGWLLFLKIYSDLEIESELSDSLYKSPIPDRLRWASWAADSAQEKDTLTGEELINFVNNELFPGLKNLDLSKFSGKPRLRGQLLVSIFDDTFNFMRSGTLLRQVLSKINQDIDFNALQTRHLFGDIYEQILKDLQSAGNAGEYYTPRAVTDFAVEMVAPRLGETVFDPACGTGGFLTAAFEFVKQSVATTSELEQLKNSIKGIEKKQLPHTLCATNMMIHGIEVPFNIVNDNTLARPLRDYGEKDQVDVILTNPPFGGVEEDGIENNFPSNFRTKETADLFVVLVIELLKATGRAVLVLPDSFLEGDGVKTRIKEHLLSECNVHTIVRLPNSVFQPYASVRTNLVFIEKGSKTRNIWFYELLLPDDLKAFSKTRPIKSNHFDQVREWWSTEDLTARHQTEDAFLVSLDEIKSRSYNLDFVSPNRVAPERRAQASIAGDIEVTNANLQSEVDSLRNYALDMVLASGKSNLQELFKHMELIGFSWPTLNIIRDTMSRLALAGGFDTAQSTDRNAADLLLEIESLKKSRSKTAKEASSGMPNSKSIPKNWAWARVLTLFETVSEGKCKIPTRSVLPSGRFPVIDQGKVPIRGYQNDETKVIHVDEPLIVFGDHTREVKYVDFDFTVGADGVKLLKPIQIDPKYAYHALKQLDLRVKGYGRHFSRLREEWLALPPLEEQIRIRTIIDEINERISRISLLCNTRDEYSKELSEAISMSEIEFGSSS